MTRESELAKQLQFDAQELRRVCGPLCNKIASRMEEAAAALSAEGPDTNLAERCKEILAWQKTGVLPGEALRTFAEQWKDNMHKLMIAEKVTAVEAMQFVLSLGAKP